MKNLLIGVIIGILLCAVACYLVIPKIKQTAYDNGYAAGTKKGTSAGIETGIAQGIAQIRAEQKHAQDSIAAVEKRQEEIWKAAHKHKKVAPPLQNWHVIEGKIAEPIPADKQK